MKNFILSLIFISSLSSACQGLSNESQIRIGILKKVENCTKMARNGDYLLVHYIGKHGTNWNDATVFDSTIERNKPFGFVLGIGEVVDGLNMGVLGMCEGEKRKLKIPPHLAYAEKGLKSIIPPDATLLFEIELVEIERSKRDL